MCNFTVELLFLNTCNPYSFIHITYILIFFFIFLIITLKYVYIKHHRESLAIIGHINSPWLLFSLFSSLRCDWQMNITVNLYNLMLSYKHVFWNDNIKLINTIIISHSDNFFPSFSLSFLFPSFFFFLHFFLNFHTYVCIYIQVNSNLPLERKKGHRETMFPSFMNWGRTQPAKRIKPTQINLKIYKMYSQNRIRAIKFTSKIVLTVSLSSQGIQIKLKHKIL